MSYEELVDLCLTFTVPNEPAGKYEVTLTYFDEDADTVTIASTDELIDAIEQFSKAKVLRVATEVKAKAPVLETPVPVPPREERSGPSMASRDPIPPQVHNVLDTFVGVLSMAVSHLQEGLAASPDRPSSLAPTTTAPASAPGVPEEQPAIALTTPQEKNPETLPFLHFRHTCDSCRVTPIQGKRFRAQNHPDYDLCEDCYSNYTGSELTFKEIELEHDQKNQQLWRNIQTVRNGHRSQNQERNPPAVAAAPTPAPPVPFIHGRHTCDSCLTTPIIGKRFHAVNMPDYDLCENCHLNYTGSAIRFEAAELERDRPFQVRWQRRHQNMERFQKRRGRLAMNHQRRFAMRNARGGGRFERARVGSSGNCESEVIPISNQVPEDVNSDDRAHGSEVQPSTSSSINRTHDFDDALKEAIRRSLRDITDTESASPLVNEQPLPATSSENTADSHGPVGTEEELEPDIVVDSEETINTNVTDIVINDDSSMKDNHTLSREDAQTMEDAMDTASVDSEKLAGEADGKPAVSSPGTARYFKDASFESDAAGSGDVAEAVGATLDLVAGMISDMLTEADMPEGTPTSSDAAAETDVKEEAVASSDPGALIVDEAVSGESEWEVVGQDGEDDFANPNEEMARAAEMLGSALFNSSTKDSEEHNSQGNVSTLSDSFSIPSTVPSIHVGESQRARWLAQLEQLRELGFEDEAKCVEILERLQAANIGVESGDDDVDLAKVVDLILQDN